MSTSAYLDLCRDRDEQLKHVNSLASELDEERRKLVSLERAIHEQHERWKAEAIRNARNSGT